jgi:hypothetical protein
MRDSIYAFHSDQEQRKLFGGSLFLFAAAVSLFIAFSDSIQELGDKWAWLAAGLVFGFVGLGIFSERRTSISLSSQTVRCDTLIVLGGFRLWSRVFPMSAFEAVVVERCRSDGNTYARMVGLERRNGRRLWVRIERTEYAAQSVARRLCSDTGLPLNDGDTPRFGGGPSTEFDVVGEPALVPLIGALALTSGITFLMACEYFDLAWYWCVVGIVAHLLIARTVVLQRAINYSHRKLYEYSLLLGRRIIRVREFPFADFEAIVYRCHSGDNGSTTSVGLRHRSGRKIWIRCFDAEYCRHGYEAEEFAWRLYRDTGIAIDKSSG